VSEVKTVEQLEAELKAAKAEYKELTADELGAEALLRTIAARKRELVGYGGGIIQDLERQIEHAKLVQADATKRLVYFKADKGLWENEKYIVDKVTDKRIYIRIPGGAVSTTFNRDGIPVAGYRCQIDLERTFGTSDPEKISA